MRKVKQIAADGNTLYVLFDDGTVWERIASAMLRSRWQQVDLPVDPKPRYAGPFSTAVEREAP